MAMSPKERKAVYRSINKAVAAKRKAARSAHIGQLRKQPGFFPYANAPKRARAIVLPPPLPGKSFAARARGAVSEAGRKYRRAAATARFARRNASAAGTLRRGQGIGIRAGQGVRAVGRGLRGLPRGGKIGLALGAAALAAGGGYAAYRHFNKRGAAPIGKAGGGAGAAA